MAFLFQPACGPGSSVTFTNGHPVDQRNDARTARIGLSSPLAEKLRDAPPGGAYRVSGHLFARTDKVNSHAFGSPGAIQTDSRPHFEGAQPNGIANVTNPQYLVQFTGDHSGRPLGWPFLVYFAAKLLTDLAREKNFES